MPDSNNCNRRKFLQITGVVTGAAAAFGLVSVAPAADQNAAPEAPKQGDAPHAAHAAASGSPLSGGNPLSRGRMFFTNALEFATLSEAAERIFPKDDIGPGAKELAVPYFIDNQLAGAWGYNAREYTSGPHFSGVPGQGYQTPLLRRDVFKQGLLALNKTAQDRFKKNFPDIGDAEKDAILTDCAAGKIAIPGAGGLTSAFFFSLLREAVIAGAYSDPIYNGNNNMDGWRMKNYPGAQMSYEYLMASDKFEKVDPVSLSGMQ